MNKTKFTVAISCYNIEKYVERAINSVLNQTFKDYELIIIDDCSTDNTDEIIAQFSDLRIRYLKNEKNSGAGQP